MSLQIVFCLFVLQPPARAALPSRFKVHGSCLHWSWRPPPRTTKRTPPPGRPRAGPGDFWGVGRCWLDPPRSPCRPRGSNIHFIIVFEQQRAAKKDCQELKWNQAPTFRGDFFPLSLGQGGCAPLRFIHPISSNSVFYLVTRSDVDTVWNQAGRKVGLLSLAQVCNLKPTAIPNPPRPGCRDAEKQASLRASRKKVRPEGHGSGLNALQGWGVEISEELGLASLLFLSFISPTSSSRHTHLEGGESDGEEAGETLPPTRRSDSSKATRFAQFWWRSQKMLRQMLRWC